MNKTEILESFINFQGFFSVLSSNIKEIKIGEYHNHMHL